VERFEILGFFAGAHELDGLADNGTKGECGTAAGIAIELGQDGAGDAKGLVEVGGDVYGLLAGGGVEDEEDFGGLDQVLEADEFLYERFIDLKPAGSIEDQGIAGRGGGVGEGIAADLEDILLPGLEEDGDVEFVTEDLELVHGGGAIHVCGDEEDLAALFLEEAG